MNAINNTKDPWKETLRKTLFISGCGCDITNDASVLSQKEIYNHFSLHPPNVKFSDHQMAVTQHKF